MADVQNPAGASSKDTLLLTLSILAILGGIVAFYWFDQLMLALRIVMVLAGMAVGLGLAWISSYGRDFGQFAVASRVELRKVVWPEREETVQTTIIVFIFAFVMGLFFWGLDWVLTWMTRLLSGQSS